jgi:hypothetical protein
MGCIQISYSTEQYNRINNIRLLVIFLNWNIVNNKQCRVYIFSLTLQAINPLGFDKYCGYVNKDPITTQSNAKNTYELDLSDIEFTTEGVTIVQSILHSNDTFDVEWQAINQGSGPIQAFTDLVVIAQIPERYPPSDDRDHLVAYNSNRDGTNPNDFLESLINPGQRGNSMRTTVAHFR